MPVENGTTIVAAGMRGSRRGRGHAEFVPRTQELFG